MASYPILVFPTRATAPRLPKHGGGGKLHKPTAIQQRHRVGPQLAALAKVVEQQTGELRATPTGVAPEQVLVFEIVGTIDDFVRAVHRVEGMEWLAEWTADDVVPDEFFFDKSDEGKSLPRRLFFITANQKAMDELLGLWKRWQADPTAKLPHGFGKWKDVFQQLRSIRRWDVRDRLLETGVIEDWRYQIVQGSGIVYAEIEFWFRSSSDLRNDIEHAYETLITAAGGQVVSRSTLPAIGYHAFLVQLPTGSVASLIGTTDLPIQSMGASTDWLYFDQVVHVRATGQISVRVEAEFTSDAAPSDAPVPATEPLGALLDGMPLTQHVVLRDRLVVDDPLDWGDTYPPSRRRHGTAMASNVICGDLNDTNAKPLRTPLYVRPVMRPREDGSDGERIPRDVLSTDLIHTAVRRMFEGDGAEPPAAPSVRVINLSICDTNRPFFAMMSPLARLLDWLSFEYDVLFVISAGNHGVPIILDVPRGATDTMAEAELQKAAIRAVLRDARNRRLLSPAESINGLTVGASHADKAAGPLSAALVDPIKGGGCASPIGALGFGFRRSIKPDVLSGGGRQPYRVRLGTSHTNEILDPTPSPRPFGISVAAPGAEGDLAARAQVCGTSNAAADVTRNAVQIIETLDDLRDDAGAPLITDPHRSLAAKCLIAHGCEWGDAAENIRSAVSGIGGDIRDVTARLLGYGCTAGAEVTTCSDERATVLGVGELTDGAAHVYELPLPAELSGRVLRRRLKVTIAWNSPIRIAHQKYRGAARWFVVDHDRLDASRRNADWQAVQRGTIQHEVFEGAKAVVLADNETLRVTVNCRADAGRLIERIPYVLAVTLEVAADAGIQVYDYVRTRLLQPVSVRA